MYNIQSLIIGFILGVAVSVYIWASHSEKKDKKIELNRVLFSSKKLEQIINSSSELISNKVATLKRQLTEEEKNEIIAKCCKDEFCL